jgi:hypothetical protein
MITEELAKYREGLHLVREVIPDDSKWTRLLEVQREFGSAVSNKITDDMLAHVGASMPLRVRAVNVLIADLSYVSDVDNMALMAESPPTLYRHFLRMPCSGKKTAKLLTFLITGETCP